MFRVYYAKYTKATYSNFGMNRQKNKNQLIKFNVNYFYESTIFIWIYNDSNMKIKNNQYKVYIRNFSSTKVQAFCIFCNSNANSFHRKKYILKQYSSSHVFITSCKEFSKSSTTKHLKKISYEKRIFYIFTFIINFHLFIKWIHTIIN